MFPSPPNPQTVYDNDCKYCLFKGNLHKKEDQFHSSPDGVSDEVSGEVPDEVSGEVPGEVPDEVPDEVSDVKTQLSGESPTNSPTEPSSEPPTEPSSEPAEAPLLPHHLYSIYWLNDSTVGLILSDRHDASATRVLAVNIHGGIDTLSLPFSPASCVFQQVVASLDSSP